MILKECLRLTPKMNRNSRLPLIAGVVATIIGFSIGGPVFEVLAHESSHAVVCLLFRLPYSWSWNEVVYVRSPNNLVNLAVRLAGGMGQSSFSLLFFWYLGQFERKFLAGKSNETKSYVHNIVFGFRLAFLTISFHGIITGLVEGLLYEVYAQTHDNIFLWGLVVVLCGIISFRVLHKLARSD